MERLDPSYRDTTAEVLVKPGCRVQATDPQASESHLSGVPAGSGCVRFCTRNLDEGVKERLEQHQSLPHTCSPHVSRHRCASTERPVSAGAAR